MNVTINGIGAGACCEHLGFEAQWNRFETPTAAADEVIIDEWGNLTDAGRAAVAAQRDSSGYVDESGERVHSETPREEGSQARPGSTRIIADECESTIDYSSDGNANE